MSNLFDDITSIQVHEARGNGTNKLPAPGGAGGCQWVNLEPGKGQFHKEGAILHVLISDNLKGNSSDFEFTENGKTFTVNKELLTALRQHNKEQITLSEINDLETKMRIPDITTKSTLAHDTSTPTTPDTPAVEKTLEDLIHDTESANPSTPPATSKVEESLEAVSDRYFTTNTSLQSQSMKILAKETKPQLRRAVSDSTDWIRAANDLYNKLKSNYDYKITQTQIDTLRNINTEFRNLLKEHAREIMGTDKDSFKDYVHALVNYSRDKKEKENNIPKYLTVNISHCMLNENTDQVSCDYLDLVPGVIDKGKHTKSVNMLFNFKNYSTLTKEELKKAVGVSDSVKGGKKSRRKVSAKKRSRRSRK